MFAAGPRAVASHGTAAWLWGVPGDEPEVVDVIIPHRQRRPTVAGARIHRPRDHKDLTPLLRERIPTSNILRTMCDLGALAPAAVDAAAGHVITTKLVRPDPCCAPSSRIPAAAAPVSPLCAHMTYRHIVRHPAATAARIRRTVDRWTPADLGAMSSGFRN